MSDTATKSRVTQGLSFEPDLLAKAKEKAKANRQSLSAYVMGLLASDLGCQLVAQDDDDTNPER